MAEAPSIAGEMPGATSDTGRGRRRPWLGRALWISGLLLVLAGLGIGGSVAWQLWGTGLTTQHWQSELRPGFEKRIDTKRPQQAAASPVVHVPGDAIAIMQIPRLDLDMVVVEGTDTESLKRGPGHYENTAYPWQDHGAVAIAGHRTTYLHPFYSLEEMRPGDPIVLQTEYGTFHYRVTRVFITSPTDASVLDQTVKPTLVLTTCNPRYSAAQRLIVDAVRID